MTINELAEKIEKDSWLSVLSGYIRRTWGAWREAFKGPENYRAWKEENTCQSRRKRYYDRWACRYS